MRALTSACTRINDGRLVQKQRYRTSRIAKRAARRVQAEIGGRALKAYRCTRCEAWHIGHPQQTRVIRIPDAEAVAQ